MIPIYRAKKIGSDEYVEGYYFPQFNTHYIFNGESIEIDPSTLAINFPDMTDSEGTKIFASLSEDGKGGDKLDLLNHVWDMNRKIAKCVSVYYDREMGIKILNGKELSGFYVPTYFDGKSGVFKVTGIQE